MRKKLFQIDCKWKEYAVAGCVCVLFAVILINLGKILGAIGVFLSFFRSIFLGFVFAYIINPLAMFLSANVFKGIKKDKLRWILSVIISLIVVFALVFGLILGIIPQLIENISTFINNVSGYIASLIDFAEDLGGEYGALIEKYTTMLTGENGLIQKAADLLTANLGRILKTTSSIGNVATAWGIGFIFCVYFLISKDAILEAFKKFFKLVFRQLTYIRGAMFLAKFNSIFSKYIICEILDSLLVGVLTFIFMVAFRMPNALLISVVCGVTNLAPTFGPIIGLVVGAFILLLVDVGAVVPFIIFTIILQACDGYVIKPKLFGGALDVPGVLILIAIIIFGKLLGVAGMLIAIPAAAIIVYLYDEVLIPYLEMRKDLQIYKGEREEDNPELEK